jgi:hypothetical protein
LAGEETAHDLEVAVPVLRIDLKGLLELQLALVHLDRTGNRLVDGGAARHG